MTQRNRDRLLWAAALVCLAAGTEAGAVPRYAARYEQNCTLCHTNPTGGGLRTPYASQYLVPEEIAAKTMDDAVIAEIDPQIGNNVVIGADLRTVHLYSDADNKLGSNFFEMQGDLYLSFQVGRLGAYLDTGISGRYEVFGTAYVLPADGYFKAGRFLPAYGWKLEDHTAFVREQLGFFPPTHTDVGIEAGIYPGRFALHAAVTNGNPGATIDDNTELAAFGRAEYRFNALGTALALGASAYRNPRDSGRRIAAGLFGYAAYSRLSWIWEVDGTRVYPTGESRREGLVTSHEVAFAVVQGLDVLATYDFHDPDLDNKSGARTRWGGGVAFFAAPLFRTELLLRTYAIDEGPDVAGEEDHVETVLTLHFLY